MRWYDDSLGMSAWTSEADGIVELSEKLTDEQYLSICEIKYKLVCMDGSSVSNAMRICMYNNDVYN